MVVIIIAMVAFDLGDSDNSASSLPTIQIGSAPADQGQGTGTTLGQGGSTGSTMRAGNTTVISGDIRVQPGHGYQGGPPSTGSGR